MSAPPAGGGAATVPAGPPPGAAQLAPAPPLAPAAQLALAGLLVQPLDSLEVFARHGNGVPSYELSRLPEACQGACCQVKPQSFWDGTAFGDCWDTFKVKDATTGVSNYVQLSYAQILGQFYLQIYDVETDGRVTLKAPGLVDKKKPEKGNKSHKQHATDVLSAQRVSIRNWGFKECSSAKVTPGHTAISGAVVSWVRLSYDHFRTFSAASLQAARNGAHGFPAIHPKVFPRGGRAPFPLAPIYLHCLSPAAFKDELKVALFMEAATNTHDEFLAMTQPNFANGAFVNNTTPFAHHFSESATADAQAHAKIKLFHERVVAAGIVTETESMLVKIHPVPTGTPPTLPLWAAAYTVDYSKKASVCALASELYKTLASSYKRKSSTTRAGNKRVKSKASKVAQAPDICSAAVTSLANVMEAQGYLGKLTMPDLKQILQNAGTECHLQLIHSRDHELSEAAALDEIVDVGKVMEANLPQTKIKDLTYDQLRYVATLGSNPIGFHHVLCLDSDLHRLIISISSSRKTPNNRKADIAAAIESQRAKLLSLVVDNVRRFAEREGLLDFVKHVASMKPGDDAMDQALVNKYFSAMSPS